MITKDQLTTEQLQLYKFIKSLLKKPHKFENMIYYTKGFISEHRTFSFNLPRQFGKSTLVSLLANKDKDLIISRNLESSQRDLFKEMQSCSPYSFERFTKGKQFRYIFLDETELPSLSNYSIFKNIDKAAIVGLHTK